MAKHVLVVEDDRDVRELLQIALAGEGHSVVGATSIEEAIRACEQRTPDVITLDLALSRGREGLKLVEWCARRTERRPKIIVVSALPSGVLEEVRRDPRIAAVVSKPFDVLELLAVVESLGAEQE